MCQVQQHARVTAQVELQAHALPGSAEQASCVLVPLLLSSPHLRGNLDYRSKSVRKKAGGVAPTRGSILDGPIWPDPSTVFWSPKRRHCRHRWLRSGFIRMQHGNPGWGQCHKRCVKGDAQRCDADSLSRRYPGLNTVFDRGGIHGKAQFMEKIWQSAPNAAKKGPRAHPCTWRSLLLFTWTLGS